MNFGGSYYFDADQQTVWNLMTDPQCIAAASPGVEELSPIEGKEDTWRVDASISTALMRGIFNGSIQMTDRHPIDSYRLILCGEGHGSILNGTAHITLVYDEGLEQTIIRWDAEAHISGDLARIGQPVFKATANFLSKQFFRTLAKQLPSK